jgi:hypothetical protein
VKKWRRGEERGGEEKREVKEGEGEYRRGEEIRRV